jgi:hypothetical protein
MPAAIEQITKTENNKKNHRRLSISYRLISTRFRERSRSSPQLTVFQVSCNHGATATKEAVPVEAQIEDTVRSGPTHLSLPG